MWWRDAIHQMPHQNIRGCSLSILWTPYSESISMPTRKPKHNRGKHRLYINHSHSGNFEKKKIFGTLNNDWISVRMCLFLCLESDVWVPGSTGVSDSCGESCVWSRSLPWNQQIHHCLLQVQAWWDTYICASVIKHDFYIYMHPNNHIDGFLD